MKIAVIHDYADALRNTAAYPKLKAAGHEVNIFNDAYLDPARVGEQVRAGIQSLPRGQRFAGLALGRAATAQEIDRAQHYLLDEARGLVSAKSGDKDKASELSWTTFCQALFASAEFRFLADSLPNQSAPLP